MENISFWEAISKRTKPYPQLTEDIEVDVAIVGAGITGISCAAHLLNAGKKVAILEANLVGSGTTGNSTGNLYVETQPYFQNIIHKFDLKTAKAIAQSRELAINYIEKNVNDYNLDCNFARRPWFLYADDDKQLSFLKKEVDALQKMNFAMHYTIDFPFTVKYTKAAVMQNQARFNPLQYVIAMAKKLHEQQCLIYEKTRALNFEEKKSRCIVMTNGGKVTAKNLILATHTPIGIHPVQFYVAPYRSYAVAVRLKNNNYPEGQAWDLNKPHHSTCTHAIHSNHPELLMVAGNHHKTGQCEDPEAKYHKLEQYIRKHYDVSEIAYRWSAQHYQPADDLPYIGLAQHGAKRTYIATGYSADGLLYGTIAGVLLADLIVNTKNPLNKICNSKRFTPFASLPSLMKEGMNVLGQYLKDLPTKSFRDDKEVNIGEGKVMEINGEKCGIYRDSNNKLHIVSAVCTHMKCIVGWNDAEKTWDCPCHGSRFTHEGTVIEGPALSNLKRVSKPEGV